MTQSASMTNPIDENEPPSCCHHWVIQPATGPVSAGVCQVCGESREFKNYVEASTWGDDKSASRTRNQVVEETVADHIEKDDEE